MFSAASYPRDLRLWWLIFRRLRRERFRHRLLLALYLGQLLGYPLLRPIGMELPNNLLRGDGVGCAKRRHFLSILDTVAGHPIGKLYVWQKGLYVRTP